MIPPSSAERYEASGDSGSPPHNAGTIKVAAASAMAPPADPASSILAVQTKQTLTRLLKPPPPSHEVHPFSRYLCSTRSYDYSQGSDGLRQTGNQLPRKSVMTSAQTPSRLLPLVGAYNFRDLGGYPTRDGRYTRWGRLFRSDTLDELTDSDLAMLREVGLVSVIDLRTTTEVERSGRGLLGTEPLRYVNLSVLPEERGEAQAAPANRITDTSERYLSYLEVGRSALIESFRLLADHASYPLVFHCQAGKDRTGVLAALVLSSISVEREAIVDDYMLTATRMDLIIGRLRRDPKYRDRIDELPPSVFTVEAATMERFLDGVEERYGGSRFWALQAGVDESELDALSRILLAGPQPT